MTEWPTLTLGELTASTRPISYGVLKPGPYVPDGVPLLRVVDLAGDTVDAIAAHRISADLHEEFRRSQLRGGEVLLSIQGTVGRVALCPPVLAGANISRTLALIQPDDRVLPAFLRYFLLAQTVRAAFKIGGTTRASLNIGELRRISVPVPPILEQRRIVAVLEHHLSRLNVGTEYLRAGRRRTEVAKQALIDELFLNVARHLEWPLEPLEAFATTTRAITDGPFGSNLTSAHYTASGALVVRLQNIGDGEFKDAEAFVSLDHYEKLKAYDVRLGDVVVASLGDRLPRAAVVPDLRAPAIVKADCIRVRPDPDVDPRWLVYACRSRRAKRHAAELLKGVGRQRLGLKGIKSVPVPRVPLAEQQGRLAELEEDLSTLGRTSEQARRAMGQAEGLRRAVLSAAFGGHL